MCTCTRIWLYTQLVYMYAYICICRHGSLCACKKKKDVKVVVLVVSTSTKSGGILVINNSLISVFGWEYDFVRKKISLIVATCTIITKIKCLSVSNKDFSPPS